MALCSLSDVKIRLGIAADDDSQNVPLSALIDQVSALIEKHVGSPLSPATYTDYLDGTNTPWINLTRNRVQSITTVHVDPIGGYGEYPNSFGSTTLLTEGTDYALRSPAGLLYRVNNIWPRPPRRSPGNLASGIPYPLTGPGNIKVVYVAGLAEIPDDLILATVDIVSLAHAGAGYGGQIHSESYDGYSYSLGGMNTQAVWMGYLSGSGGMILNRYRRLPV